MSGHSKWATIKRAKAANDQARGKVFSRLSRQITMAVKEGGGGDPNANYKLRMVIDAARAQNMPKENIERAIAKSTQEASNLSEITYEGFGPENVNIIIVATTDNKNRTSQEIKNLLERSGGSLGGPNSVSFNFESKGLLAIERSNDSEAQILNIMDLNVSDVEEVEDEIYVYTEPSQLYKMKDEIEALGNKVLSAKLVKKPINLIDLSHEESQKVYKLMEAIDTLDEVDDIFVNLK